MKKILLTVIMLIAMIGIAQAGTVGITWNAPTTNADGSPITLFLGDYKIYQARTLDGSYTLVHSLRNSLATVSHTFTNVPDGQYCYYVTAVNTVPNESAPSNKVCKTVETPPTPGSPMNITVTVTVTVGP